MINSLKQTLHGKQALLGKSGQLLTFSCQSRQYEAVREGTFVSTYKKKAKRKAKDSEKQNSLNCLLKNEEIVDQL